MKKEYYEGLKLVNFTGEEIKEFNDISYTFEKIKTLFSISYLRNSVKELRKDLKMPFAVDNNYNAEEIILSDGSRKYSKATEELTKNEIYKNAQSYINGNRIYQLDNFNELDKNDIKKFLAFIKYLKANNVEISLYFPPYHPFVYKYIESSDKFKHVLKAENFFFSVAQKENFKTFGSYNPDLCDVDETDFSDGMHLRTTGYEKIFKDKF